MAFKLRQWQYYLHRPLSCTLSEIRLFQDLVMNYKDLNVQKLGKYLSDLLDNITCINCCKYYVVPTSATCGHSLCYTCYRGRRNCASCGLLIDKKALRINVPLQIHTEHAINLKHTFESLFDKQLDDFTIEPDQQQHVNEWLASSENQFSAPVTSSQPFTEETVKPTHQITSEIQVHSKSKKVTNPQRETIKMNIQQEDWDKIEEMPETENNKSTENPIGPMDIETFDFVIDDEDYSASNPRRSARNKLLNISKPPSDVCLHKKGDNIFKMNSDKMTNNSNKIGNDLKNVKKTKKKFSEMNKKKRNKLNVSIEMCKKAKIRGQSDSQHLSYKIDNNTPEITATDEALTINKDFNNQTNTDNFQNLPINVTTTNNTVSNKVKNKHFQDIMQESLDMQSKTKENIEPINQIGTLSKVNFFKRGPLETTFIHTNNTHVINVVNPIDKNPDRVNADDIEITIKIGNHIRNICIQKKENDLQLKTNTDREIQTSLCNCTMEHDHNMRSLENGPNAQHIVTAANNNVVEVLIDNPVNSQYRIPKEQIEKSSSTKKNTSSADTSTAHIEITESEEREFADHMENVPLLQNQDNNESKKLSKSDCTSKSNNSENVTFINMQEKSTHNLVAQLECSSKSKNDIHLSSKNLEAIPEEVEISSDMDIFDGESVKEGNVQTLQSAKNTPSAILMPTIKSKYISQKKSNKRGLDSSNTDLSINKKMRHSKESIEKSKKTQDTILKENVVLEDEAENINYDAIMSQVFANINADMELQNTQALLQTQISNTQKSNTKKFVKPIKPNINLQDGIHKSNQQKNYKEIDEKYSENVFSLLEKEEGNSEIFKTTCHKPFGQTQHLKDKSTSEKEPNMAMDNNEEMASQTNVDIAEFGTPMQDDDDDKSIVEETPQKKTSFIKNRNQNESKTLTDDAIVTQCPSPIKDKSSNNTSNPQKGKDSEDSENVIISNSAAEVTEIRRSTLETPLTINNFVDKITYKSTPLARKSLNFDCRTADSDPEETICPSSVVAAKTTQEREFMSKAFEQTLESPSQTFCVGKQRARASKLCVAGSCLMSSELAMLKELCSQREWTYVDKFTKDLTHLVVGVDEENKAQRSVKFICALASSKWIVSFAWVKRCLLLKKCVDEEPFEALDATGEPGPRRSRLARVKLLQGLTFYCLPPFTIIDIQTLKDILEAAGGRVESERRALQAGGAPTMLLAEPENTQEDRQKVAHSRRWHPFTSMTHDPVIASLNHIRGNVMVNDDLAMELKIVPVNYEWVLNCLGTYTLKPIFDLLLCPPTLLPPGISCWPSELISPSDE